MKGVVPVPDEVAERYRSDGFWTGDTLDRQFEAWCAIAGERVAIVHNELRLSYAELAARVDQLARGLASFGLEPDDRVVVQLPNVPDFLVLVFALFRLGVRPILALPPHRAHELVHMIDHSEAVAYVVPSSFAGFNYLEQAAELVDTCESLRHVLAAGTASEAVTTLDAVAAMGGALPERPSPSDVALFLLSGGTTDLPKLIPRTHDDYLYNVRASAALCGFTAETRYLISLPVAHNFPFGCPGALGTLSKGGTVVLARSSSPDEVFPIIQREHVTATAAVPAVAIRWCDSGASTTFDLSSLDLLQVGGAVLPAEAARRIRPTLGCRLQQVFGMAEGLLNYTRLDDPEEVAILTQGRPMSPGDEVRIVDANDCEVPTGERGELLTRGPYTIRGYFRAPEINHRAFTHDGFYRTGDIVRLVESGNFVVEGRTKDLINRGGEKISAEEIENLILSHEGVREVAVVAMPSRELGERACAYVVLRTGHQLDLESLRSYLISRRIASFKLPERLEVVEALPFTHVGKVDKKSLRTDVADKLAAERSLASPAE